MKAHVTHILIHTDTLAPTELDRLRGAGADTRVRGNKKSSRKKLERKTQHRTAKLLITLRKAILDFRNAKTRKSLELQTKKL